MKREIDPNFELLVCEYIERFGGNYIGSDDVKRIISAFSWEHRSDFERLNNDYKDIQSLPVLAVFINIYSRKAEREKILLETYQAHLLYMRMLERERDMVAAGLARYDINGLEAESDNSLG